MMKKNIINYLKSLSKKKFVKNKILFMADNKISAPRMPNLD
jgi:hypothetical protein